MDETGHQAEAQGEEQDTHQGAENPQAHPEIALPSKPAVRPLATGALLFHLADF
jgi:hypothetical protein